ncbi:hypothetical protein [Synergistes jonesii]|uniref:Uncharacterized protein n=1 Tax=Synergistes jonesii TaxID=2754 RepID=A0A073IUB5_9BACT|nr:hypothetical protein [Synergistes jonesii]KEJ93180.1 hypothetical protein EH55_12815 [Synergistes jonesii]OFB60706.1 hypothetical protein JS72_12085 [Synergistes jonesii]OFB64797.1 hypothetical protein JS73_02800 [Synergistes jonesii]OFB66098.1 hypothetical protein JS79_02805 [Synergistes jonesii]OFB68957.1 hypothetical protein JS78_02805 [Synergistes jonesii]
MRDNHLEEAERLSDAVLRISSWGSAIGIKKIMRDIGNNGIANDPELKEALLEIQMTAREAMA